MDKVARFSDRDRADLFAVAAEQRRLSPEIIEKDFWVCWMLKRVFSLKNPPAKILFKGGTSLSKAYGVIDRFSEDIDLVLDRAGLGFTGEKDPAHAPSRKQRQNLIKELKTASQEAVRDKLLPILEHTIAETLGIKPGAQTWRLTLADDDQTILFTYPAAKPSGSTASAYIRPEVRLELGARGDHWPAESKMIQPYAAQEIPAPFTDPSTQVHVLKAERTFWEKATLLHMLAHIDSSKPMGERHSRHYYDLHRLATSSVAKRALADMTLLTKVAEHKQLFYPAAWACYEDAKPGSLRLLPAEVRFVELRKDYAEMGEMIFGEPPPFDTVIDSLRTLEDKINATDSNG